MRRLPLLRHTTLIAAILCGTSAAADVTAQQVWDSWTTQMETFGQGFSTGGEEMSGDTLTVSDVRIEMTDDDVTVLADLGDIALTENGDGTVSISIPDSYPMTVKFTPEFEDPGTLIMTVRQSNMDIEVSGEPDAMQYDISADLYSFTADSLEGAAAQQVELGQSALVMRDMAGTYSITEGEVNEVDYSFDLGALDIDVNFADTGGSNSVSLAADMAELAMAATVAIPPDMDMDADVPPFIDGLAMTGGYTFGDVRYVFDIAADGENVSGTAVTEGGRMDFGFDYDGASYSGGAQGIDVSVSAPQELPFPIDVTMAKYGFDFAVPLSAGSGGPRDARLAFDFTDLSVSDGIWNLFDPAQTLPRDAITLALGLDLQITPFFDFLDPAQQEAMTGTDVPGELNAVTITDLTLRAAGAEITGDGAFTFDNTDVETFDGFPRPEGEVNLAINGVNGLIDNLIEMGLIPQDQAMMPRMMLGMFATPVGDDMLTSTLGVNSEGHVLANGQRLR